MKPIEPHQRSTSHALSAGLLVLIGLAVVVGMIFVAIDLLTS